MGKVFLSMGRKIFLPQALIWAVHMIRQPRCEEQKKSSLFRWLSPGRGGVGGEGGGCRAGISEGGVPGGSGQGQRWPPPPIGKKKEIKI